ncbi:phosphomannomutase [Flavimobilis marinus]|uniref:Phosphomannomutase n=1 Tax=Flavimobilis marinus TaxID=285351 RepID=A0A1I2DRJ0_9MICO|nr:phospho-sugar mutase [Flavimobilis marinus]GHG44563.1 phosphomannomutase [Flavimobilis marinus]SFE82933.1 phosphomannomutase [Flavimobilis marinus]
MSQQPEPFAPDHALRERVATWIADDPDPVTRAELQTLLDIDLEDPAAPLAQDALADAFSGLLQFGTAGLRGRMAGGPNRMNRAVVIRAAAGLAAFLLEARAGQRPSVAIGYDARYNSQTFARDTAAVMTAAGVDAHLLPRALPTPVLAFAVRDLGTDAGVMVTASHNPPEDNGYKVYLGGQVVTDSGRGAQIVPPYDADIARHIGAVRAVADVPRAESGWTVLGDDVAERYRASVIDLAVVADPTTPRDLKVVYTPLHGVGGETIMTVLGAAGYTDVLPVEAQMQPDPDFPTVSFPNPEEPGAIDLALAYAIETEADLVVANDPDADRCALAVRDPHAEYHPGPSSAGHTGWRMLHGDEVGALLGAAVAQRAQGTTPADGARMANSIVSSRLLSKIAAAHGYAHSATLTGFKWISREPGLVFGYEEALGYCVDPIHVRDKDGISAALLLVQLADQLKAQGRSIVDALDDLAREHGLYVSDQLSARFTDLEQIPSTMARLRSAPPATLGGSPVVSVVDLAEGADGLPPTDGLRLIAADDTRVIVRPSGTEPKVKCYLEVVAPVAADASFEDLGTARRAAREKLDAIRDELRTALGL